MRNEDTRVLEDVTVAASLAASFFDFAVASGVDATALLSSAALSDDQLRYPDGRVAGLSYLQMQRTAIEATADTGLPLRYAATSGLWHRSVVGLIIETAGPFPDAIAQLNRYTRLLADIPSSFGTDRFKLRRQNGMWLLIDRLPISLVGPSAIEETFASLVSCFRQVASTPPIAFEMWLTIAKPPHYALYDEIFAMPVHFGARHNALRINELWMDPSREPGNPYAAQIFKEHADALLVKLGTARTCRSRLEEKLLSTIHTGSQSMESISAELGMSKRTLQRHLNKEGTTFAEVYDALRLQMAKNHLTEGQLSVAEIAYLVGYSETPAFIKAFKRWTGESPARFRATV